MYEREVEKAIVVLGEIEQSGKVEQCIKTILIDNTRQSKDRNEGHGDSNKNDPRLESSGQHQLVEGSEMMESIVGREWSRDDIVPS